jgi:alkylated DNA repair dioxygenase AlkB
VGELVPDHEYFPNFLDTDTSTRLMNSLMATTPWRDDVITLFGRTHRVPRRTALFGDPGARYTYSRIVMDPVAWPADVQELRERIESLTRARFNAVLVNLYRDGRDSNGWHADDEIELGDHPVIASVSLGASRTMKFRRRDGAARWSLDLEAGSLLVMTGDSQSAWFHSIPKQLRITAPRINLTFRQIAVAR